MSIISSDTEDVALGYVVKLPVAETIVGGLVSDARSFFIKATVILAVLAYNVTSETIAPLGK